MEVYDVDSRGEMGLLRADWGPYADINTLAWYMFPGAAFGSEVIDGDSVTTVELSLTDGELGDSTGVDGQIVDPGGPALFVPEPRFGASFLYGLLMLRWLAQRRRGRLESRSAAG